MNVDFQYSWQLAQLMTRYCKEVSLLTLKSELNLSDNYLDIFKKNCDFIDSYDLLSLKNLLIKLSCDINELENFKIKYLKLRNLIMNGFNKVDEEKLNIFSLSKNGH